MGKKRVHKEEKKAGKGGGRREGCEWRLRKCRVTICTDYDQSRPDGREKRVLKIEQCGLKKSHSVHLHVVLATGKVRYNQRLAPGESSDVVLILYELEGNKWKHARACLRPG